MPVAALLVWFDAIGAHRSSVAVRRGLWLSIPATAVSAWLFRNSSHIARDEFVLAALALLATGILGWCLWRAVPPLPLRRSRAAVFLALVTATILFVIRQTMEIGALLGIAVLDLRSVDATISLAGGAALAAVVAWSWVRIGGRLSPQIVNVATKAFTVTFVGQLLLYAFHEAAEARLLPFSEAIHTATEPYGPDGIYGVHFSDALVLVPIAAIGWFWLEGRPQPSRSWRSRRAIYPIAAMALVIAGGFIGVQYARTSQPGEHPYAPLADVRALLARPHVLFRSTTPGDDFGRLSVAALDSLERRVSTSLPCERVSYAGDSGLCLRADRGLLANTYTAFVLDDQLSPVHSFDLEGRPSRTRISSTGEVGAITVFVTGDGYAAPSFSTRTTIVDMTTGTGIGQLEEFSTWRDGSRVTAPDVNFWGVTFSRDGDTFYGSLRTEGDTYLVQGELALRKLTVLRRGVECPSLSPDGRWLAYKKRVGPSPDSWRFHVLDLTTNIERLVDGERRYVDDQVEWLDSNRILYAVPRPTTAVSDVWVASIDGSDPPRIFLPEAESPIVVQ